jgi:hypothetical protein
MVDEPKAPGSEKKEVKIEARRLAESQGLNWKELPKEKRRKFKTQARDNKATSAGSQSMSGGKPRR